MVFGRYGSFPFRFGGGTATRKIEHLALLDALAPGWDGTEGTVHWCETYALALGASMIWRINSRLALQLIPSGMQETLPTFEAACKVPPGPRDSLQTRRGRVAAKFAGIAGNAYADIYAACAAQAGNAFVGLVTVAPELAYVWWRGGTPGRPGHEWSSARCLVGVLLNGRATVTLLEELRVMLDPMVPSWLDFVVGVNTPGPVPDVAVPTWTMIGP